MFLCFLSLAEQRGAGDQHAGQGHDNAGEIEIDKLVAFALVHGWVLLKNVGI